MLNFNLVPVPSSQSVGLLEASSMQELSTASTSGANLPNNYAAALRSAQYDPIPTYRDPIRYTGLPEA